MEDPIKLFHGSGVRVPRPQFGLGNPHNDYGLGFYCTREVNLAREWACPTSRDGYVNEYRIDMADLAVLDLEAGEYGILDWLALLVENRRFESSTPLMKKGKEYLRDRHHIDLAPFDAIRGYRADDSYFSFARAFLDNRISLRQLERAMRLGELGIQYVLKSRRAFDRIEFVGAEVVDGARWGRCRMERDAAAREGYRTLVREQVFEPDDVFMIDLIRRGE